MLTYLNRTNIKKEGIFIGAPINAQETNKVGTQYKKLQMLY